jgi:tetrahydromethanopterin S-methyltransferase subunit G
MSTERFDRLEKWQATADDRFDRIDGRFDRIDERFARVDGRFDRVDQRIGVLHEDVLSRIAAVAEGFPRLEAKMDRRFDELVEMIGRRLDPLEATVRHHSAEIAKLAKRRS